VSQEGTVVGSTVKYVEATAEIFTTTGEPAGLPLTQEIATLVGAAVSGETGWAANVPPAIRNVSGASKIDR
jgi:hypothetical protein